MAIIFLHSNLNICFGCSKEPSHYVSPLQARETYCFPPGVKSVPLSVCHKSCPLYNLKPLKLYSGNFIQISISMRWRAECKDGNSAFYSFELLPFELCASQKFCPLYNLKSLKLYSRNFIQISISMRWDAECKNGNTAFYTFWVISLWTLCITKIVSAL